MHVSLNLPLNSVSFGQLSFNVIRSLFDSNIDLLISPIGQVDASSQSINEKFASKLKKAIEDFPDIHRRSSNIFKIWHLNGGIESFSEKQILLSFYELDSPTKSEINCVKNNYKVCFSSKATVDLFKNLGCDNVFYLPLAFDKYNFFNTNKKYFEDRITFNLVGKLEKRKHHVKLIKAWIKKYGNNKDYSLQCAIYNPFIKEDKQKMLLNEALNDKKYFNISFLSFMQQNILYNDFLNSGDIVIGMSGGEGWGLPEFHSVALGKYGIIMDGSGYRSWADKENSILVKPSSKIEAYDDIHFLKNSKYNQGNILDFKEDDFIDACEKAISLYKNKKINEQGLKLQKDFSPENLVKNITNIIK